MKLYKLFFITAIAIGFMACNADDQPEVLQQEGDSYASITVKFPGKATTRALPEDYNQNGTWTGRDTLETVDVFLVNVAKGVVDYNSFSKSAFQEIDVNGVLHPNLALKATAGESVRVYVVINGEAGILSTLKATSATNFATAFAASAEKVAAQVARLNANGKETIMMTNDVDNYVINVVGGVSEEVAKAGGAGSNNVLVNVERVVSRAFMTVTPATGGGWPVKAVVGGIETQIATVTGVSYAVGQSNKNFYIMKKSDYTVPAPVYGFIPAVLADWTSVNMTNFDYAGLTSFTSVTEWTYDAANVSTPLATEATSKFVLPVNHANARENYKKGNTTYFEIRATFMPLMVDGATPAFTVPTTVFWGENDKKFYSTRALAEAQGQKATEFTNGIMKYVLWLNPNSMVSTPADPNPKVSPTIRNQVYHAHINEFLRMGLPNNPLNPVDPDDSDNPDNPINPEDLLKTDYTYLSVSVKVLPWTIHSYQYSLTDPGTMY
ncbi:MAG TPA: hypothetical protein DDZ57_10835 [Porphyromonadaceae bacterium]|jgi:hypothetical protein|nr:hypothetical protein [Porphyromonadaceae bacterium]